MSATGLEAGEAQRRRVRRSALLWALIAAGCYLGFILLALLRAQR